MIVRAKLPCLFWILKTDKALYTKLASAVDEWRNLHLPASTEMKHAEPNSFRKKMAAKFAEWRRKPDAAASLPVDVTFDKLVASRNVDGIIEFWKCLATPAKNKAERLKKAAFNP